MKKTNEINVQSILILQSLYMTRNTYKTAESLNISQSKVTRVLGRLRGDLNDRLLIRVGNDLLPTPYFEAISGRLSNFSHNIEKLFSSDEFDPSLFKGQVAISINRAILSRFGVRIYRRLIKILPNATWKFEEWNDNSMQKIEMGSIILGINYQVPNHQNIVEQSIAKDSFFALVPKNIPHKFGNVLSVEELCELPMISWNPSIERDLEDVRAVFRKKIKKDMNIILSTDSLSIATEACINGKGIMISASRLVSGEYGLTKVSLPELFNDDDEINRYVCLYTSYINSKTDIYVYLEKEIKSFLLSQLST
ncbi:LysR family transcriptional regulator [Vibrio breoganii]|uniref:LysR family transcriptional regulator n=1 Tax=Vibrio breoganii TaxID=553239 RepID=UPI000C85D4FA|nr:LysR family transcriptional regulator [Vibrio breoganii]PMK40922.1 hypothetical protein BCU00_15245 [Vibrio breoganii]